MKKIRVSFEISEAFANLLEVEAGAHGRSLVSEIILRIERSFDESDTLAQIARLFACPKPPPPPLN